MALYYTINDFSKLAFNGIKYELNDPVLKILKVLCDNLPPMDDTKKSIVKTNKQFQQKTDDWSAVRSHNTLTPRIREVKEGTEQSIKEIRIALNKLSNKNADIQQESIVRLIKQVISDSKELEEDMKKIYKLIFDIVSTNEFYSALYAKLYKDLIGIFPEFSGKIVDILNKYKESFNNIKSVDSNADYDGFCDNVKNNDLRRAMTTFIMNLLKNEAINEEDVINTILYLVDLVRTNAEESDKSIVIEETIENIFIFIVQGNKKLNQNAIWKDKIIPNIHEISKFRKTDLVKYKSMTSRSTFKLMDIIDELKSHKS
jgi:hypothetical protein